MNLGRTLTHHERFVEIAKRSPRIDLLIDDALLLCFFFCLGLAVQVGFKMASVEPLNDW